MQWTTGCILAVCLAAAVAQRGRQYGRGNTYSDGRGSGAYEDQNQYDDRGYDSQDGVYEGKASRKPEIITDPLIKQALSYQKKQALDHERRNAIAQMHQLQQLDSLRLQHAKLLYQPPRPSKYDDVPVSGNSYKPYDSGNSYKPYDSGNSYKQYEGSLPESGSSSNVKDDDGSYRPELYEGPETSQDKYGGGLGGYEAVGPALGSLPGSRYSAAGLPVSLPHKSGLLLGAGGHGGARLRGVGHGGAGLGHSGAGQPYRVIGYGASSPSQDDGYESDGDGLGELNSQNTVNGEEGDLDLNSISENDLAGGAGGLGGGPYAGGPRSSYGSGGARSSYDDGAAPASDSRGQYGGFPFGGGAASSYSPHGDYSSDPYTSRQVDNYKYSPYRRSSSSTHRASPSRFLYP